MNVTELITALEYFKEHGDGHLQLFSEDSNNGETPINKLEIRESISPRGIKYLLLNEEEIKIELEPCELTTKENAEKVVKGEMKIMWPKKKITIEKTIMLKQPNITFTKPKKKRGRPKKKEEKKIELEPCELTPEEIINKVVEGKMKKITITKEKRTHKCFICHEPVTQGTGLHARIPGEERRKLCHKKCHKEYKKELRKEGTIKKKRHSRCKMRKDFTGYNKRCLRCKLGKPSTDYTKGNHYCKECREEQRKNRENKT